MILFSKYDYIYSHRTEGIRLAVEYHGPVIANPPAEENIYRVQTHKRFLGIPYWKTLIKTTSYKIAKDAYDLMLWSEKIGF